MIWLPILATILFPIIVYMNERGRDGVWRPRGRYGFITKRQAVLRFIPIFILFWMAWMPYVLEST